MTPDEMNRVGLWLGLISGLLLIPEIVNLIPFDRLEKAIERFLGVSESFSNLPQKMHPQSWKRMYTEEGRRKYIEPITAILGFVASTIWIAAILVGIYTPSTFFFIFGLLLPAYIAVERVIQKYGFGLSIPRFITLVFCSLIITFTIAPLVSLIRIFLIPFQVIVLSLKNAFVHRNLLRLLLVFIAVVLFVASNLLQLLATY